MAKQEKKRSVKRELTCTFYWGGKQVERLTPEQIELMAKRMSEAMSTYYTRHPEEYVKL